MHNFLFLCAIGSFVSILVAVAGYYRFRSRRSSEAGWEELVGKLTWIDRNTIALVALEVIDDSGKPRDSDRNPGLEPSQLWKLLGGLKGLEVLEANSEILIELASHVQQRYPEALAIAEQLRLDARELQWHVGRLKGADQTGNLQISFPFYAQRAVATYYLMTRRLLDLYEAANLATLGDLQRAL